MMQQDENMRRWPNAVALGQLLRQAYGPEAMAARPACAELCAAIAHAPALGEATLPLLLNFVAGIDQLPEAQRAWADEVEGACQLPVIRALAQLGQQNLQAFTDAYAQQDSRVARDCLCEAAAQLQQKEPALFALMLTHLRHNPFVAALCLAEYGDSSAIKPILATLQSCVDAIEDAEQTPDHGQQALHIEGILEAIGTLDGVVPLPLQEKAIYQLQRARGRIGAFGNLLQPHA